VLEISTNPTPDTAQAGEQLRRLRAQVRGTAAERGLTIGSAGTHPFAMWEDQRIVARERYRDLVTALRFVARQELIFGMHVHVALDDPDKAIHVANGMRVHLAVLLALSANSPFWRADATGLLSSRTRYDIDLLGPTRGDYHRRGRENKGFAAQDFTIDWERSQRERRQLHGCIGQPGEQARAFGQPGQEHLRRPRQPLP